MAGGSLIGTLASAPGANYFLYDSTAVDELKQNLVGVTYDKFFNPVSFTAAQTGFTFTGNIATANNVASSNGLSPNLATSLITNIGSTATLVPGAAISGAGVPAGATILEIVSSTSIRISGNVTATTASVTLTSYLVPASDALMGVATTSNNTTQWIKSKLVGVNGATDINNFLTANPTLATQVIRYNGQTQIPVVSFNFIGGN